jgi:galactokinase
MKLTGAEKEKLDAGFVAAFTRAPQRYFSAPGRTEIGGNHTDHQGGKVLAGAVELDTRAAVGLNGTDLIRVVSEGYPVVTVCLAALEPKKEEENTTAALVRGVAARFEALGHPVEGFDAWITSTVLPGSGLSSSAAFEVLLATVINGLFDCGLPAEELAKVGQYAENVYFGKPCGLMDQMASAVGGLVSVDFADPQMPRVRKVDFDFAAAGYALCIIDTHASHAQLTGEYAAVPAEMKAVAAYFGCDVLSQVPKERFYQEMAALRQACGDRSVLRAIHFYEENRRVDDQLAALERKDLETFLALVNESGRSSYMYLQNVIPGGSTLRQDMAVALALCEKYLQGRGACRVHGGGFAGTVQAFVPQELQDIFCAGIDEVLGQGSCHVLRLRGEGGTELEVAQ